MPNANNKDADQPVRLSRLISIFVVCYPDSITPIDAIPKISRLQLASVTEQAGSSHTWSQTAKDKFSRDVDHFIQESIIKSFSGASI